jgi:thiopurine S-methyltransferase
VEESFWKERWAAGQIGFHEGKPNEQLTTSWDRLGLAPDARVLVPLAGKAFDLEWLAARGHEVVGVEIVLDAIEAFFGERQLDLEAHRTRLGRADAFAAGKVTLVHADMLQVSPEDLGTFDAIYDRAALVALEPSTRARYVEVCRALAKPEAPTLLISFAYDVDAPGPPWSIDEAAVGSLYAPATVEVLDRREGAASPRLAAAGVQSIEETAYRIAR